MIGVIDWSLLISLDITLQPCLFHLVATSFKEDPPAMMLMTPAGSTFAPL